MAQTARISVKSDHIIQEINLLNGKSKIEIIESALEAYRHSERMRLFNDSYHRLSKNKKAWAQEQQERTDLAGTLNDGLETD